MKNHFSSDTIYFNNSLFGYMNSGQLGNHKSLSLSAQTKKVPKNPELRTAIQNNDIFMICLKRCNEKSEALTNSKIDIIFNRIAATIEKHRYVNRNQYVFVQFSECFFGENKPLDNAQVAYIVEKCRQLSAKNNVLIISTFMHKFNISNRPNWLKDKHNPITKREEIHERVTFTSFRKENGELITKHMLVADDKNPNRIANYALVFYEHKIVAIYRKSTYHGEYDEEVNPKNKRPICAYEFGDFKTHAIEDSSITDVFVGDNALISLRICSDLNFPQYSTDSAKYIFVPCSGHPVPEINEFSVPMLCVDDKGIVELLCQGKKQIGVRDVDPPEYNSAKRYCVCYPFDFRELISKESNQIFVEAWREDVT